MFGSDDAFEAILDAPVEEEPAVRGGLRNETHFIRGYAEWTWKVSDRVTHQLSAAAGYNSVFLTIGPDLFLDNQAVVYTVRDDLTVKLGDMGRWRIGLDSEIIPGRIRISLPLPPKEGDSRSQSLSSRETVAIDKEVLLLNPAAWTEFELKFFDKRLLLVPGFRVEYDGRIKDYAIDPRFSTRYTLVKDSTTLKAGVGLYAQRPSPDESDESFGDPNVRFERALHSSIGVEQKLGTRLEIDVIGFYKAPL